ncbi:hypothetical protein BBJ29_004317 [Phytophthora kernoviae]|uniref:Uncharacterized protein n=1 Tax=Phytophthora kernoviae TaxID=325452 RepID=A0A3R7JK17_9STRA|nr:hypothetical protein BBJ29_004317 [Phytophthora kernoviae]
MIAYVDATNINCAVYRAERLGYLVAVTFLVRNSQKYVERQGSDLYAPVQLVAFEFFVQVWALVSHWKVAVAGAVVNCFQAVDYDGGDAPLLLPVVLDHVPQVIMVIVVLSIFIIWGTRLIQWSLRSALLDCTSVGLEWKQQTSALSSALILVICEFVDAVAIVHTWLVSRARGEVIYDWGEQEVHGKVGAKQLILTFFDRWKDCGMVSSFLNQSEMTLLVCEVPTMAWASWTCCQRGSTPERLSYQLHRYITILTIVMGMNVVEITPTLDNDIAGAVVFLIADVVLTMLRLYEGRHRRRERRRVQGVQRLTMTPTNAGSDTPNQPQNHSIDVVVQGERRGGYHVQPKRSESVMNQCLELKRLGVWKQTVLHGVPAKEWAFALLDCAYSVLVVLNFYETVEAADVQVIPGLLEQVGNATTSSANVIDEDQLMDNVDDSVLFLAIADGISRTALDESARRNDVTPDYFAVSVVAAKAGLLPASIYVFAVVFVQDNLYTPKRGVNALVADLICAIGAARAVDSLGRAIQGLGRSAVGLPGADAVKGSKYEKASIALQVLWDRFNDFLAPLGIVHLVVSTTEVGKNFIVIYFVLIVCVLHAMIAYVDAVDITSATYLVERLGYLIAVTFLVRNSAKYVEREGIDLFAPVLLVAMEFMLLIVALVSLWKGYRQTRHAQQEMEKEGTGSRTITRSVVMLASMSGDCPVLSPSPRDIQADASRPSRDGHELDEIADASPAPSWRSKTFSYQQM